jgi:tRNA/tmRNA/rRNA uracil-C5-methylase (TrmA/RlmC/RlmD family)
VSSTLKVGDRVEVDIGPIANGGHFVARHNGQVIFVRHAIEGERALIEITGISSKLARADAISIINPAPSRVESVCANSGPGKCGGCDFLHISIEKQLELKGQVVKELFSRMAKIDIEFEMKSVEPKNGLNWRTRVDFAVSKAGRIGFFSARSNDVVEIDQCPAVVEPINSLDIFKRNWRGDDRVEVAATNTNQVSVSRGGRTIEGQSQLVERVGELKYQLSPASFWQGHINAASTLVAKVLEIGGFKEGDQVLDLYGGAGLFAKAILTKVPAIAKLHLIESNEKATSDARKNLAEFGKIVSIHTGRVEQWLTQINKADVVVIDPPRSGTGDLVNKLLIRLLPRKIVYVSCDPASLARDTAQLIAAGYKLGHIVGFDLFPNTQHIECVATFTHG